MIHLVLFLLLLSLIYVPPLPPTPGNKKDVSYSEKLVYQKRLETWTLHLSRSFSLSISLHLPLSFLFNFLISSSLFCVFPVFSSTSSVCHHVKLFVWHYCCVKPEATNKTLPGAQIQLWQEGWISFEIFSYASGMALRMSMSICWPVSPPLLDLTEISQQLWHGLP